MSITNESSKDEVSAWVDNLVKELELTDDEKAKLAQYKQRSGKYLFKMSKDDYQTALNDVGLGAIFYNSLHALTPQIQLSNERKENTTPPMSTSSGSRLLNLDDLTPVRYRNVMAAINREFAAIAAPDNAQDLTELVNVLYRQEYLFKHKLGEQEVVFIIPPQTLQVCTASIEEFSGLMIRPAYADLAMKLLSSKDNACIKGTPGIGKSMFALYLIHLFVTDTSLQNASSPWKDCIHLVYDYGQSQVFHFTRGSQHFTKEDRNKFADREYNSSTLIHLADGFAFDSSCHRLRGRLIYISSPNLFSQSRINKNMILLSYFMPVWSLQEIEQCNEILHLVEDKETLNKLYNNFGGCPRFVLYYASHRNSATLLQELDKKINENDPQQVIDYIVDHKYTKDVSSSLVHYVVSLDFENITYTFASNYIKSRVISALERGSKRKLVRFLRSSAGISLYQKLRGNLFESLAHDYIACHKEPSRVLKLEPFKDKVEIKIDRPTRTHKFTNDTSELSKFIQDEQNVESVYFKPTDESHGTVDAFSLPNVFYQMTVSKSHSLTITENFVRIIDVMKQHDPDFQTCIFVWVLPDDVFEQFKPPKEITYSFEVTDEQKKYYSRMIKQFKMQIRLTDDLWEQLSSSTISSQNKEE